VSCKKGEPLPPVSWRYGFAVFFGALAGVMAFLFQQYVRPSAFAEQLEVLVLFMCGGALACCAVVALRNRSAWRAYLRQEQRRGFEVARRTQKD
jgi:hypothetical protein